MGFFNIDGMGNSMLGGGVNFLGNYALQQQQYQNQKSLQEQQQKYNQENMGLNYRYNEQAAGNAYNRAVNWFNNFNSPAARRAQLEAAGLSVGLMYGGGGGMGMGGASTGPQGGSNALGTAAGQAAGGAMGFNMNPSDAALARKLNAEADVIEEYGGKEKEANIALTQAQEQAQQSQKALNESLAKDADAHAAWQGVQEKLAGIDLEIKSATKEDQIALTHKKLDEMQAGIDLMYEKIRNSKNETWNRDKLTEEMARWYHAEVFKTMAETIGKNLENQVKEGTLEDAIKIIQETARKAAAEATNEEDFIRRFDEGMKQRRLEAWLDFGVGVLNSLSNIAAAAYKGQVGKMMAEIKTLPTYKTSGTNADGTKWEWTRYGSGR